MQTAFRMVSEGQVQVAGGVLGFVQLPRICIQTWGAVVDWKAPALWSV